METSTLEDSTIFESYRRTPTLGHLQSILQSRARVLLLNHMSDLDTFLYKSLLCVWFGLKT